MKRTIKRQNRQRTNWAMLQQKQMGHKKQPQPVLIGIAHKRTFKRCHNAYF